MCSPWLQVPLPGALCANTVHYVLTAESRLALFCQGCDPNPVASEPISGSFDVTEMPVPADYAVDAITGLHLQSASNTITGTGFLQRLGADRMAMVVKGNLNGLAVLLTSGRRQPARPGEIRMQLTSPKGAQSGLRLTIVAVPAAANGDDADADSIGNEVDNCAQVANPAQTDVDADGSGDACDQCPDTPLTDTVIADGCSLGQQCPCDGPTLGSGVGRASATTSSASRGSSRCCARRAISASPNCASCCRMPSAPAAGGASSPFCERLAAYRDE